MIQRVDIYVLEGKDKLALPIYACRIVEKAWLQGSNVVIQAENTSAAEDIDDLLWRFSATSFIPHHRVNSVKDTVKIFSPVIITTTDSVNTGTLVQLAQDLPASIEGYERIADLVGNDSDLRQAGRRRYRQYQKLGIKPCVHNIST